MAFFVSRRPVRPRDHFQSFPGLRPSRWICESAGRENEMKAMIYAQLNPVKSMHQLIGDRCVLRVCIVAVLLLAFCR